MLEEHIQEEACLATLEAHLHSLFLVNSSFVRQFLVLKVKLWHSLQHPEHLSVELLFQIGLHEIIV